MAAETSTVTVGSRSGTGGATADSYIGSLISLTSKSEIRYEGILYNINTEESSIGLRNVRSFGTEGRKMDGPQVPPSDKVYEYILFRGTDIKDLQVKASPPVQTLPPVNNDPAIIQSHYPRPPTPPTNFPGVPSGSSMDLGSHYAQMGLPSSTFQSELPLYQPGGNMNSWAPSPPNANGTGLPMPMYWPGFHSTPNGLPQQSFLRSPPGLSVPPIQQMQFSGFNRSLPMPPSSLPISNFPDYQSSLVANSTSSVTLTSTSTLPPMQQMQFSGFNPSLPMPSSSMPIFNFPNYQSSLVPNSTSSSTLTSISTPPSSFPFNVPPLQPMPLPSETTYNPVQNKFPVSAITASAPSSSLTSLAPLPISVPNNAEHSSVGSKPSAIPSSSALPSRSTSPPVSSVVATSGSVLTETPSLVSPGQLLQSGPSVVSVPQPLQTTHNEVEVVQVSAKTSPQPSVSVVIEAQPPILPLPPNTRAHKSNGGTYHMHNNYRGRGGRGSGISRPVTKFTEEFDFTAMNEKFNKDEVWGHLGKSNKSLSKEKEEYGSDSDEDPHYEYDAELPIIEVKPVYNKDDFFDSLSCNSLGNNNNTNRGRPRYSEQMKLDTETFGDFSRYRGGRGGGGRGGRGGGRFRGSYYGRGGYGGYGYGGRGRGHGTQNRTS